MLDQSNEILWKLTKKKSARQQRKREKLYRNLGKNLREGCLSSYQTDSVKYCFIKFQPRISRVVYKNSTKIFISEDETNTNLYYSYLFRVFFFKKSLSFWYSLHLLKAHKITQIIWYLALHKMKGEGKCWGMPIWKDQKLIENHFLLTVLSIFKRHVYQLCSETTSFSLVSVSEDVM